MGARFSGNEPIRQAELPSPGRSIEDPPILTPGASVSCWLEPKGEEYTKLADVIDRTAALLGTPRFEPHVTLLGGLRLGDKPDRRLRDLIGQSLQLAHEMEPLKLVFKKDALGFPQWNQCLLSKVHVRDGDALSLSNASARRRFLSITQGLDPNGIFDAEFPPPVRAPHCSYAYTEFANGSDQQAMIKDFNSDESWLHSFGFTASSISLWDTTGGLKGVPTWRKLVEFPMCHSSPSSAGVPRGAPFPAAVGDAATPSSQATVVALSTSLSRTAVSAPSAGPLTSSTSTGGL